MSKDANSFGPDKALAWESRGFVYTKRGCIVSTHPLIFYLLRALKNQLQQNSNLLQLIINLLRLIFQ